MLEQIKTVLRHKFFSLLEGHIPSEEECRELLETGLSVVKHRSTHRVDLRKHNMAKGAVPPVNAAVIDISFLFSFDTDSLPITQAIRLRAALDNSMAKNISGRGR